MYLMTLTGFFTQLKKHIEQSDVYIDRIDEVNNSVYLVFKSSKITDINVTNFTSTMKDIATKYGFKDVQIFTRIDKGGN